MGCGVNLNQKHLDCVILRKVSKRSKKKHWTNEGNINTMNKTKNVNIKKYQTAFF